MASKPRTKSATLTEENLRESARLKELWVAAKHGMSQEAFGQAYGIGNQGMVWQCLNGKQAPISLKAARGFAAGLKCNIADFSPRLAALAAENAKFAPSDASGKVKPAANEPNVFEVLTADEQAMLNDFRSMMDEDRAELREEMSKRAEKIRHHMEKLGLSRGLPIVAGSAAARRRRSSAAAVRVGPQLAQRDLLDES